MTVEEYLDAHDVIQDTFDIIHGRGLDLISDYRKNRGHAENNEMQIFSALGSIGNYVISSSQPI